jgi:hypothetical protein
MSSDVREMSSYEREMTSDVGEITFVEIRPS